MVAYHWKETDVFCSSMRHAGSLLFSKMLNLVLSQLDVIDDAYIGIPIVGATCISYIYIQSTFIYVYIYIQKRTFVSNM